MKVPARVLGTVFSRVFRSPAKSTASILPALSSAVEAVSRLGANRLKEFLAALPIFVVFLRELLRRRNEVGSQKQLVIIGAAAAFSTLVLVALGGLLGSLPVQLVLLVTHPWVGLPLFLSTGLVLSSIMAALVWLIVYVLNVALSDDPIYRDVRDKFMPPTTREILATLQNEIEDSGADIEALREAVEERLKARASAADAAKLEKELQRIESQLRRATARKLVEHATLMHSPSSSETKPVR
jgi:hypothetical protein